MAQKVSLAVLTFASM